MSSEKYADANLTENNSIAIYYIGVLFTEYSLIIGISNV